MDTSRCRAFLASAENGTFTKTAEVLNYTTSGVSQLVTALEADLGLTLLDRTRKGVHLTQTGENNLRVFILCFALHFLHFY